MYEIKTQNKQTNKQTLVVCWTIFLLISETQRKKIFTFIFTIAYNTCTFFLDFKGSIATE